METSKMIERLRTWNTSEIVDGVARIGVSSNLPKDVAQCRAAMVFVLEERYGKEIDAITTEQEDADFLDSLEED